MSKSLEEARNLALSHQFAPNRHHRRCLSVLHERLTEFLPDFIDPNEEFINLARLAMALDMTYAGVHRWMRPGRPNRITPSIVDKLCKLSEMSEKRSAGFRPAGINDFWEFVST